MLWIQPGRQRWYAATIERDLFGELVVIQRWGGIGSRRSQQRLRWVVNRDDGIAALEGLARRRASRRYEVVKGDVAPTSTPP